MVNSRRFPRVDAPFPVQVEGPAGQSVMGEAVNLSPFGVKIRNAHVAPPAIVRLNFTLRAPEAPFSVLAAAVRAEADGTAFAFLNLTKADFLRLRREVERLYVRRQLYIMVVEDDRDVAETLADHAEEFGYAVVIMPNAEEALAYLAQDQPDAILLDLYLPRMSGLEFLQELARQGLRLPVVVVSAASELEAMSSLRAGVLHFLRKPLDLEQFRLTLDMLELSSTKSKLETVERAFQFSF